MPEPKIICMMESHTRGGIDMEHTPLLATAVMMKLCKGPFKGEEFTTSVWASGVARLYVGGLHLPIVCVTSQGPVHHLDGNNNELPTLDADVCRTAAGANVIVVCQVNIKNQFL